MQARQQVEEQAQGGIPPVRGTKKPKVFSLEQETLVREFTDTYGLDREQISFESEASLNPIFDFAALSTLALELSDIPSISVEPADFNPNMGLTTAICKVTLKDNRQREVFGNAIVGEILYDGTEVADFGQALNLAQARALRTGLRAVGFDPVRAHRKVKEGAQNLEFTDRRTKQLARAHMLGKELGYIVDDNKVAWRNQIHAYFRKSSSADLDDKELSQWVSMLEAWASARARVSETSMASVLLKGEQES